MIDALEKDEGKAREKLHALADELEQRDKRRYATIIRRCRNDEYLDFSSNHAAPKMLMHQDLLTVGLTDIDQKMQDGEYDT